MGKYFIQDEPDGTGTGDNKSSSPVGYPTDQFIDISDAGQGYSGIFARRKAVKNLMQTGGTYTDASGRIVVVDPGGETGRYYNDPTSTDYTDIKKGRVFRYVLRNARNSSNEEDARRINGTKPTWYNNADADTKATYDNIIGTDEYKVNKMLAPNNAPGDYNLGFADGNYGTYATSYLNNLYADKNWNLLNLILNRDVHNSDYDINHNIFNQENFDDYLYNTFWDATNGRINEDAFKGGLFDDAESTFFRDYMNNNFRAPDLSNAYSLYTFLKANNNGLTTLTDDQLKNEAKSGLGDQGISIINEWNRTHPRAQIHYNSEIKNGKKGKKHKVYTITANKKGGKLMNYFQDGGQMEEVRQELIQLISAAQSGNQEAILKIQQYYQAALQGDQTALEIVNMIEQLTNNNALTAKYGAKLQYIKRLRNKCPEGFDLSYYKSGGQICTKCIKKIQTDKCGGKAKKQEKGGESKLVSEFKSKRCGGKVTKQKKLGGNVTKENCSGGKMK